MKSSLFAFLTLLTFTLIILHHFKGKEEFSVDNITFEVPKKKEWSTPPLFHDEEREIHYILSQPYSYLGKGHQLYAFASRDGQYVLKFIKFSNFKQNPFLDWFPKLPLLAEYKMGQKKQQQKKFDRVFNGYALAYAGNKETTGVIYIHLQKTNTFKKNAELIDRNGFTYFVDLDSTYFILQKKATVTKDVLKSLLNRGEVATAKLKIRQIFDLYILEFQKKLADSDHNVMVNTGFVKDHPIHLDVGRLVLELEPDQNKFKQDLVKISQKRFGKWIYKNYPQYYEEMAQDMNTYLQHIFEKNLEKIPT